jgi:O-antigen ligase
LIEAATTERITTQSTSRLRHRAIILLGRGIYASLLLLISFTAIPYGTVEPWWKAFFVCCIFILAIGWIAEGLLSGSWHTGGVSVLLPMVGLAAYALLQTIPLRRLNAAGIESMWSAISADAYQTRFFALQIGALAIAAALFFRYARTRSRISTVIHVILGVAVVSAVFGILRQTTQSEVGFGLPLIKPGQGYGQFINKNHFAFLMEMALGLALGLMVAGKITRERAIVYLASLLPIWTALVLANSRGGLLAMLAQFVLAAVLFNQVSGKPHRGEPGIFKIARNWTVRIGLVAVLIAGIVGGTVWVGGDRLISNIEAVGTEFDPAAASRYGSTRTEIWQATGKMIAEHPIAGVGLGGYWVAISAYHDSSGKRTPHEAHSDYLELLASGGIIGFGLGIWFVAAVWKRISSNLKSRDSQRRAHTFAATLAIAGVAVHSLVDFGLHMMVNALIFIALITIATAEKNLKPEADQRLDYV